MAAGESSLIGLNPASGVVLLHKVPAGLGQTVLQSGDQGKQATLQVDIQTVLTICLETKVTLWNGIPLIAPFTPALQTQVGTSTPESWILPPDLLNNILWILSNNIKWILPLLTSALAHGRHSLAQCRLQR